LFPVCLWQLVAATNLWSRLRTSELLVRSVALLEALLIVGCVGTASIIIQVQSQPLFAVIATGNVNCGFYVWLSCGIIWQAITFNLKMELICCWMLISPMTLTLEGMKDSHSTGLAPLTVRNTQ
jgi:hypothetical protein